MKRFKILWIILGVIAVLVGGGFIFANYMIDSTLGKITTTETLEKEEAEKQLEEKMDRWVYLNDLAEKIANQKNGKQ